MSLLLAPSPLPNISLSDGHRKRTNSFSFSNLSFTPSPRPAKAARTTTSTTSTSTSNMSSLRRTQSFLVLPSFIDLGPSSSASTSAPLRPSSPPQIPYNRSLRSYKDQRERRKGLLHRAMEQPITIRTKPQSSFGAGQGQGNVSPSPSATQGPITRSQPTRPTSTVHFVSNATPSPMRVVHSSAAATPSAVGSSFSHTHGESLTLNSSDPVSTASTSTSATSATTSTSSVSSAPTPKTQHTTSPLAPVRTAKPLCRPSFPRSKPEPDLYRRAITTRMRCSPEGQKILTMGPRLAVSIMTATRELEKIVAAQDCGRDYGRDLDLDSEDGGDIVMVDAADLISTPVTSPTTPMPASGGFLLSHPYAALPADAPLTSAWGMMKDDWEMVDCSA